MFTRFFDVKKKQSQLQKACRNLLSGLNLFFGLAILYAPVSSKPLQLAIQANQYLPMWSGVIYLLLTVGITIVLIFISRGWLLGPSQENKGAELPELPSELRVWTERQVQQLVQTTNHVGGFIQRLLCKLGLLNREVVLSSNRLELLHALKNEVRVRIEIRNLAIEQRIHEQQSIVLQTLIENERLLLLSKRRAIEGGVLSKQKRTDWAATGEKKIPADIRISEASSSARIQSRSSYAQFDGRVETEGNKKDTAKEINLFSAQTRPVFKPISSFTGHSKSIESVAFLPTNTLVSASLDGTIRLWDVRAKTEKVLDKLDIDLEVSAVSVSDLYGDLLACGNEDGSIGLWSTKSWQLQINLPAHSSLVESLAFSPDGRLLASGSQDREVKVWDPYIHELVKTLSGEWEEISSVAFSPNGKLLAAASWDKSVRIWDVENWDEKGFFDGNGIDGPLVAIFSPSGDVIVTAGADKEIRLWEIKYSKGKMTFNNLPSLDNLLGGFSTLAFSPNGKMLAAASQENKVICWETTRWQKIIELKDHADAVTSIAFSCDNKFLASGCVDKKVRLWEMKW